MYIRRRRRGRVLVRRKWLCPRPCLHALFYPLDPIALSSWPLSYPLIVPRVQAMTTTSSSSIIVTVDVRLIPRLARVTPLTIMKQAEAPKLLFAMMQGTLKVDSVLDIETTRPSIMTASTEGRTTLPKWRYVPVLLTLVVLHRIGLIDVTVLTNTMTPRLTHP